MTRIGIFASGTGSNAARIVEHFRDDPEVEVALIVSNRKHAGVLHMAEQEGVPSMIIDRSFFYNSDQILFELKHRCIDFIVLAGFLWLIPPYLVKAYKGRMINIHPALLPKYGGKGMYGMHVHEAVKAAGDKESGISIHYVNEQFDEGAIIFQASCAVDREDAPDDIRRKVQELEHRHFPLVVDELVRALPVRKNRVPEDQC